VLQVAYSFKDEVALVEVAHKHTIDAPAVRVFVKASAGANTGIGHPSAGAPSDLPCPQPVLHMPAFLLLANHPAAGRVKKPQPESALAVLQLSRRRGC